MTAALVGSILHSIPKNKPMKQMSRQIPFLSASRRRCKGGRNNSVEWTAEGGLNEAGSFQ